MSEQEFKQVILNTTQNFEGDVEINRHLSYVAVGDFYIQGESAVKMIAEIDALVARMNISERESAIFFADNM